MPIRWFICKIILFIQLFWILYKNCVSNNYKILKVVIENEYNNGGYWCKINNRVRHNPFIVIGIKKPLSSIIS